MVEVIVVGVEYAGVDDSHEKTVGGPTDPDCATVILDTTVSAGCSGKAPGLCGSTLNLKAGIAILNAV